MQLNFTEKNYQEKYDRHFTNISSWLEYTEKSTSFATKKLQESLLKNARYVIFLIIRLN